MENPRYTLNSNQIIELHKERQRKFRDRDAWYDRLFNYYNGSTAQDGGLPVLAANSQGRPLLRAVGESLQAGRNYSSRRLAPVVEDYASIIGRMPTSRVEPPDFSVQGEQKAELLTKFLYSTYEMSRMGYQQAHAGHFLSLYGDSVYVMEPEATTLRVVWNVTNPKFCWPSFYHGYRRFEIFDMIISEVWNEADLRAQWGVVPYNTRAENCTVVTYLSPHQRTVLVGTKRPIRVADVKWELDYCPAVWAFNKITGMMGCSDIANSLEQQDFLDWCFNVAADGIVHNTYPMIAVRNPLNVGENIVVGPGAPPVQLQGDGDLIVKTTQGDMHALTQMMEQTLSDMNASTGSSQVRQEGKMHGSIITGRAVQSVQGPQSTRVEFKQQVLGEAIESANKITLHMQETAPLLADFKGPIFGRVKGQSFQEEFEAARDIDGWYRTKVTWESLVGMNLQQKTGVAYEGMVAKLWDDVQAREIVGIEDPVGMRKRIQSMMLAEAALQAEVQQTQEGGGGAPGGPAGGAPGAPPAGGAGGVGGQQQQAPPPMLFRPPQMMGGVAQGGTGPQLTKETLLKALEPIVDRLKGSVWLWDRTVFISDHRDYTKILEVVRGIDPSVKVQQAAEDKMPAAASRVV